MRRQITGLAVVGNKLEQDIIRIYNRDITAFHSINEIARILGKAYPHINRKVNSLINQEILNKTEIGRSHLCTINLENDKAVWLLTLNDIKKKSRDSKKDKEINNLILKLKDARKKATIHSAIKYQETIFIILEDKKDKPTITRLLKTRNYRLQYLEKDEFLQLLLKDGKMMKDRTILLGYERYYQYLADIRKRLRMRRPVLP